MNAAPVTEPGQPAEMLVGKRGPELMQMHGGERIFAGPVTGQPGFAFPLPCTAEQAAGTAEMILDLADAGMPLPTSLHVNVPGSDACADALMRKAAGVLTGMGYKCNREDTPGFYRLRACRDGRVPYWMLHAREVTG